jgi:hypothetical protein
MFAGPICRVGAGNPPGGAMLWGSPEIIRNLSEDEPVTGWPLTMFETWEHHPSAQSKVEKPNFKSCRGLGEMPHREICGKLWGLSPAIITILRPELFAEKRNSTQWFDPKTPNFRTANSYQVVQILAPKKISNRQTWRDMIHARQLAGWRIRPLASTTSTSPDLDPWPQIVIQKIAR